MSIDPNKISKLQDIATMMVNPSNYSEQQVTDLISEQFKNKIKTIEQTVKQMYPTLKGKQHDTFVDMTKDLEIPNDKLKDYYWNKYLELSPHSIDETKNKLIDQITYKLGLYNTPTEKEHFLRDSISKWPNWLTKEYIGDLQNYSIKNADANLNKAKLIYKDDLSNRLKGFLTSPLDPDVSESVHIKDILDLETKGLLNVAKVINGRFGVVDKKGSFIPATDLQSRSDVFENQTSQPTIDEQLMVNDLAPSFIKEFVGLNLNGQRTKINTDNKVAEGFAGMLLDNGTLPIEKWSEAFSMFEKPEYTSLIKRGLIGQMNTGKVKTHEDIVKSIWQAMSQYKEMFENPVDYSYLQEVIQNPIPKKFDSESSDYDMRSAQAFGMTKDENGHYGSVIEASSSDKEKYNLPQESYLILKGRQHPTWNLMNDAEKERGFAVIKKGDRYYSVPQAYKDLNEIASLGLQTKTGPGARYSKRLWDLNSEDIIPLLSGQPTNPDYIKAQENYKQALTGLSDEQRNQLKQIEDNLYQEELTKRLELD